MYLLCISKKLIILRLFKIDTLNFSMYILDFDMLQVCLSMCDLLVDLSKRT